MALAPMYVTIGGVNYPFAPTGQPPVYGDAGCACCGPLPCCCPDILEKGFTLTITGVSLAFCQPASGFAPAYGFAPGTVVDGTYTLMPNDPYFDDCSYYVEIHPVFYTYTDDTCTTIATTQSNWVIEYLCSQGILWIHSLDGPNRDIFISAEVFGPPQDCLPNIVCDNTYTSFNNLDTGINGSGTLTPF